MLVKKLKMMNRVGIYVCLILLMLASAASAAYIRGIETKPTSIDPQGKFSVIVELGGTTCGTQMKFFVDDKEFDSKNIGCNRNDIESDDWDLEETPLECGVHELRVELLDSGEVIQTEIRTLRIGNVPNIVITPEKPNPNKDVIITFKNNETGRPISDLDVEIYSIKEGPSSVEEYVTDNKGEIKFISDVTGEFRLTIDDSEYCGTVDFWIKNPMPFAGPNPPDPVVGERIGVAVPGGVGVKYIDSEGKVYPLRNLGGGVNFTIDKAGDYTLIAGDLSTRYWSVTKKFTVSEKARMDIEIIPEKAVVDKVLLLKVTSRGEPVENARVKITKPIGGSEEFSTNPRGEVRFTPESVGEYHYMVEKSRYTTIENDFEVYNSLNIEITPDEPITDQDVTLNVTNQLGDGVDNAIIYIEDESGVLVSGKTGIDGLFKFRLLEPKEYTLKIQKDGYWNFEEKMRIYGIISIELYPEEIEIGDVTSISVLDKQGDEISADITVTKPDGRTETIEGKTYAPGEVGDHEIKATKEGYRSVTKTLKVNPHPLDITEEVDGDKVIIKVSSHNEPVSGITFVIKTPTEEKQVVTDEKGIITATIEGEGNITISANTIDINRNYESKTITKRIVKQYNYALLILPVLFIITIAFVTILIIDHLHKKRGKIKKGSLFKKGKKKGVIGRGTQSSLSRL
ncbi:MAG: hypothetical protein B6U86_04185 [Candidatus Altiarchaeales archaeon ex4484_43]|nr:MAG: hypothetical protein B6U86_04185 [Candidatus Altiarchaeales archaeon ex4484_43]